MAYKFFFPAIAVLAASLTAQSPVLRPGEGLAVVSQSGEVGEWGDVNTLSPMGNLAKLLWLHLEAEEWESSGVEHRCRGELYDVRCPKSHGRVDLAKSFKEDCNVAFYVWVNLSRERWKKDYGEGGARMRLNSVFGPFIGNRLPREPALPEKLGTEWFADGELLHAAPGQLVRWLATTSQERLMRAIRKYMLGFSDFAFGSKAKWWIKVSEAPTLQDAQKQVWVLGSDGSTIAVLRLPPGVSPKEAQVRFKALLSIK
ncbi:MAG: hypothetical protein FWG12_02320 [Holophagaceae bacterium]|nr:hypothetical protein [Holophagaceae bacterium]